MTTEELLRPRIEVMFSHPHSPLVEGEVLTMQTEVYLDNTATYEITTVDVEQYPKLFRLMSWHERREIGDMPEFLKSATQDPYVLKVAEYSTLMTTVLFVDHAVPQPLSWYLPATLSDYTAYINSKNETI